MARYRRVRADLVYADLTVESDGSLTLDSSYDRGLVAAIKAIPASQRRWDAGAKVWRFAGNQLANVQDAVMMTLGIEATLIGHTMGGFSPNAKVTKILEVEYIGQCKDRGDDEKTAMGCLRSGDWGVVFPESVLEGWFTGGLNIKGDDDTEEKPTKAATYYSILGISKSSTALEVKKAYRKAAMTWHPDHNKEDGAAAQFMAVKDAYDILSNAVSRKKYDAGLALEATLSVAPQARGGAFGGYHAFGAKLRAAAYGGGFKPPVRCGVIAVEGIEVLGRLTVTRILEWQDIVDAHGRSLVTVWPMGAKTYQKQWV